MPKQMVSWRLEPELIAKIEGEAKKLGIDLTTLVEQKLDAPHALVDIRKAVWRIEKELKTWSHD